MIKIYTVDTNNVFVETVDHDATRPVPTCSLTPPPTLGAGEFAVLVGDAWEIVAEYPENNANRVNNNVNVISMRQARLALHDAGLLASVSVAIDAMPEPDKTKAQIEWEYASEVDKNSAWVANLSLALGLDDVRLTELFNAAAVL